MRSTGDSGGDDGARLAQAVALSRTGFPARARSLGAQVLERARAVQDQRLIADATQCLAYACFMMGQYEAGIGFGREARALFCERRELAEEARAAATLALLTACVGECVAISDALAALELAERAQDGAATIWALDSIAMVLWLLREPDRALPFAERAVELARADPSQPMRPLVNLAGARVERAVRAGVGMAALGLVVADAVALTREALALARAAGDGWIERLALCNIAEYRLHLGDASGAERALAGVSATAGEATDRCRVHYLHMLGRVRAAQARDDAAIEALSASLAIALEGGDLETAVPCQKDLSDLHARLGDHERALLAYRAFHELYVRQASHAAQRHARLYTLEWEARRLRASNEAALQRADDLSATNRVLAQESERLLRASMEDPLTGLQNRRRLDLTLLDLLATGTQYAIAMIDIDLFKQVNDRFSHAVGDAVLRVLADLLRRSARIDDVIVRFGGDEFALLLRGAGHGTTERICRRLLASAHATDWSALHPMLEVTVSIGLATSREAASHEVVMALADRRLYRAKHSGRNRIVSTG